MAADGVTDFAPVEYVPKIMPRNCKLQAHPAGIPVPPSFQLADELIAYASPDSTFAVTKKLIDGAKKSILIGIYDFSAPYMRDLLLDKAGKGVDVTLMLDIDSQEEQVILDELVKGSCEAVIAPSCTSPNAKFFPCCHEKVILIDGDWTMIQSGNYSKASIPLNPSEEGQWISGNRDMGLAIKSGEVNEYFRRIIDSDINLVRSAPAAPARQMPSSQNHFKVEKPTPPSYRYKSQRFIPTDPVSAQVVLSPDNYVGEVERWLRTAKRSVWVEQQYIKTQQPGIRRLLGAISKSVEVRILLPFGRDGGKVLRATTEELGQDYGLRAGTNIRAINPRHFSHLHNKLIIVDEESVLISSQNWTDTAVTMNREAGLIVRYPELAQYYGAIFQSDWNDAITPGAVTHIVVPRTKAPPEYVDATYSDYEET